MGVWVAAAELRRVGAPSGQIWAIHPALGFASGERAAGLQDCLRAFLLESHNHRVVGGLKLALCKIRLYSNRTRYLQRCL